MAIVTEIESYSFSPDDLAVTTRVPGLSAFVRTRDGADFIGDTITSHAPYLDEIVVVHNQCTDATPEILARLQSELGSEKLKIFHYQPRVHPPGTRDHAAAPANSPHSVVNYSNFALSRTTRQIVVKLDDDHIAYDRGLAPMVESLRRDGLEPGRMRCFSGLNLARDDEGRIGIHAGTPFSGNGDIGFFAMTPDAFFTHDRRFEDFNKYKFKRVFSGFAYWHMKYLKTGEGFANYELDRGRNRRFAKKRRDFEETRAVVPIAEIASRQSRALSLLQRAIPFDKWQLFGDRAQAIIDGAVTGEDLSAMSARYGLGALVV
ncbi:MAG: glycosyl transferase [Alphaproteobacteria bacterium]